MKRTNTDTPYLSVCMIVRNCAATLEATLKTVRERAPQAELVIVHTGGSTDDTEAISLRYADIYEVWAGPEGKWTKEMFAFDDAAAARQHSFELAHGTWRMWIDSDDRLAGPEEAEKLLKLNGRWQPRRQLQDVDEGKGEPESLEDLLRRLEKSLPDATCIWAPYLYQRDENDLALIWQERERIVKWGDPPKYRWAEAAHEILVPVGSAYPPRIDFAHLLFVHEKKFTDQDYDYNLKRHYDILVKQYDNEPHTTRRCIYLAGQCGFVGHGDRELEFAEASYKAAKTTLDRYRALLCIAGYYSKRGFRRNWMECFGAAVTLMPNLPDAWFFAAEQAAEVQDHVNAIKWLQEGLRVACGDPASFVNPRHILVRYPVMLAWELQLLARDQVSNGKVDDAEENLKLARQKLQEVSDSPAIGADLREARTRFYSAENEYYALIHAKNIFTLFMYLRANDESVKAAGLLKLVPHNLRDHPLVMEMERLSVPVLEHISNPDSYKKFYNDDMATGFTRSELKMFDPIHGQKTPRPEWIAQILGICNPNALVLDVGACDGITSIPLLHYLPTLKIIALDLSTSPVEAARENAKTYSKVCDGHFEIHKIENPNDITNDLARLGLPTQYDAILWTEVIEHVGDPLAHLKMLKKFLKPEGLLFVSTPWGSYDNGHPPAQSNSGLQRGHLGHIRALLPRDIDDLVKQADLDIIDQRKWGADVDIGQELHVTLRHQPEMQARPTTIVVPGSLWPWNDRIVEFNGIGASEEMIVQLSRRLALGRRVDVYNPTPRPDTHHGVHYWPRQQLRLADKSSKVIVSRYPSAYATIDQVIGAELPKILWLQDAIYPDLTPQVAEHYEKIVVVSEWHRQEMHRLHNVPLDKFQVLYNFLVPSMFTSPPHRKPHKFIYASSPDRGLAHLVRLWPEIRRRYPDAELHVFYGWKGCQVLGGATNDQWALRHEAMRREYEKYRYTPGLIEHDMVPHQQLCNELMSSSAWLYPTDFEETCCTLALEARAAGCVPVTSSYAALNETARCEQTHLIDKDDPDYDAKWLEEVWRAVELPEADRVAMRREALKNYSVDIFLPIWKELLA